MTVEITRCQKVYRAMVYSIAVEVVISSGGWMSLLHLLKIRD